MFSTNSTQSKAPTKATGVSIQTSVEGKPIPIVYGRCRIAPNLLWSGDFQAIPRGTNYGGGSGGSSNVTSYTYYLSFIMGLCEGPVSLVRGYKGSKKLPLSKLEYDASKSGARTQTAWGYFSTTRHFDERLNTYIICTDHTDELLYYPGIAYVAWANRKLGSSASLPNYNFEVDGFCQYGSSYDCDPSVVIKDYLTNQYYGCGFPAENIATLTLYSKWCRANGLLISTALTEQQSARETLESIIEMTGAAAVWSNNLLKIIPYGEIKVAGNGVTYTPPEWTGVELTTDDFIPLGQNEGLVRITRKNRADMYNAVQVEGVRRNHSYNVHVQTAHDDLSIQTWGYRPEDVQQAHFFCLSQIISTAAQLRLKRLAVAETYEFKLGWEHIALEPMDIVTLTEPVLGISSLPVRITEITEDEEDGCLSVTAEQVLEGTYVSADSAKVTDSGGVVNEIDQVYGYVGGEADDPGDVNAPVIFEPPAALTQGLPSVYFAVSGLAHDWGGCEIWYSLDNDIYSYAGNIGSAKTSGTILGGSGIQGEVAGSAFPAGTDPDVTNSLTIDMSLSGEQITAVNREQADAYESLSYLDGELIAYTEATLQEDGTYLLGTYIRRGLHGTTKASHAVGSQFCTLQSDAIAKFVYPTTWIGKMIHFKFRSFDIYGEQLQELDDCTAYSLAVTGCSYNYFTPDASFVYDESDGSIVFDEDDGTFVYDDE